MAPPADDDTVDPTVLTPDPQISDASTPASSPGKTDDKPGSSPEKPGVTMLDTVKAALEPKAATPAVEKPDAPATPDPASDPKDEELSEDELKQLSEKTQKRFRYLTTALKAKDTEVASLSPKAKEYDNLHAWVRSQNLSDAEVRGTLEMTGLLKNNPRAALERLRAVVRATEQVVGEILPPELQQRVDQGFLTVEDAKAQARATAEARMATARATALADHQRQTQAVTEQKAATEQTLGAVETWEAAKAKSDPDWHLKQPEIAKAVKLAILEKAQTLGTPWFPTPTEAVKLSEDALKDVNTRFSRFVPKPKAVTPAVGGASSRSASEPKTMLDVVRMAANA